MSSISVTTSFSPCRGLNPTQTGSTANHGPGTAVAILRSSTCPALEKTGLENGYSSASWSAAKGRFPRSEEHTSELQSLMRISYAVFCLKKKIHQQTNKYTTKQYMITKSTHRHNTTHTTT